VLAAGSDPVFGNPALAAAGRSGLRIWAARPFGLAELEESQAAVWHGRGIGPGVRAGVGIGVRRFGSPSWSEREARVVAAFSPVAGVAFAGAFRGLEAGGAGVSPHRSAAVDLAFRIRAGPAEIGGVAEALVGEVPGDPQGRHHRTSLGVARAIGPGRVLLEVERTESRPLAARLGASLSLPAGIRLGAGLAQDPAEITWGFGVRVGRAALDVAAAEGGALGRTVRLGIGIPGRPAGDARREVRQ
jgi:hypothetical protein